ncbi:hypothetical protein CONPUDRAFT_138222 [Coniophora puteana RWD-64-598 SS2]|uniref:F-box domain-containing protein n=1 Tax=Coniophora puteana (strain RWD-64-598) TaxID=741705 RepID=A0A5M3MI91_CONPW|nr:uncharacterized protein CONPUDRAFT_138222 [Coniophora puteana RWD-64-598 SS2]EIW78958.1 hypothetical protein CONPUDRAFT_138222 [Coniophora puteana RWD-64-598 SS2]
MFEKVTVYCPIPHEFRRYLREICGDNIVPLVCRALEELILGDEGMKDVTTIGDFDKYARQFRNADTSFEETSREELLATPDSDIRVLRHCKAGVEDTWDFGVVSDPSSREEDGHNGYHVSVGVLIMVQTFALPILDLATNGRVTPQRLWRLAMHQGWSEVPSKRGDYGFAGIDYGEIHHERKKNPSPVPWMIPAQVVALEELGDLDVIKEAIVCQGGLWVWMGPDRFPLDGTPGDGLILPALSESPLPKDNISTVEKLPFELLCAIVAEGSLSSFLSLASTSRTMHALLLGSESDRNAVAFAWIFKNAPWYIPIDSSDEENPRFEMRKVSGMWAYLRRCRSSASMRNRERIWRAAEQIEEFAKKCGV